MLIGKHILLIVSGGIAAVKSPELVRAIQKAGGSVQVILTGNAKQFTTPLALATLSGRPALDTLFDLTRETEIGHIELSRSADLIVVAPATANLLAKLAHGLADDLASTTLLATDTPIIVAPAMNVRMWQAASTQRNIALLEEDGVTCVGPDEGEMACGEYGPGRMAEPAAIVAAIAEHFARDSAPKPFAGKHVIVTSGPTREPIDPVRYISNASSGKQGTAIAEALATLGARVSFVTGPAEATDPRGCAVIRVTTADQMLAAVERALPADAAIFCAAVADWKIANPATGKLKKDAGFAPPALEFAPNPDILARIAGMETGRPALVVGFAAETENLLDNARKKRARKGCDWLVANEVGEDKVFNRDATHVVLLAEDGVEEDWGETSKREVGRRLAARIAAFFASREAGS